MTILGNGIATTIGFVCGIYWLKWSGSPWVLVPIFATWGGILVGSLVCTFLKGD